MNFAVPIGEFHLIGVRACDKRVAVCAVEAEIFDIAVSKVGLAALCDCGCDLEPLERLEADGRIVAAGEEFVLLFRRKIPRTHAFNGCSQRVEGDKAVLCAEKAAFQRRISHGNDAFIVRKANLEIIVDVCYASAFTLELSLDEHHVARVQIEAIVVVGKPAAVLKAHLHDGRTCGWCLRCGRFRLLAGLRMLRRKSDFKQHMFPSCLFSGFILPQEVSNRTPSVSVISECRGTAALPSAPCAARAESEA